ncbi:Pentatricopeptide repeat-containing protein [Glycine soja]|uniref:Pentatricopeptide repeat-containing protein n=1 Tax=Glycine soja TaxID=3848 RepID=A0A445M772_GLYSO|nr:Pentatricopeptide repeat-containing protein [Glycine soja]
MPYSSIPRHLFLSHLQKCIPKSWKQAPLKPLQNPILCADASMVGVLIASLMDFVTHGHLSNAFKTFFQIQHHAASSHLLLHPIGSLLSACTHFKSLSQGKQLHAHVISLGLDQNPILVSRLVNFYTNVNLLVDAQFVTESSNTLDPLHWNLLISAYVRNRFFVEALCVYKNMLNKKIEPDEYTYPSVLKACGESLDFNSGVEVHRSIEASSMEWSLFVHNALVSMYGKFGKLEVACHLFDNMPRRDSVSWNTIIRCYVSRGMWKEAFQLFGSMQEEGVEMNVIIWNTIAGGCLHSGNFRGALQLISQMRTSIHLDAVAMVVGLSACSHIGAIKLGKEIHGHAVRTCFDVFDNVKNALITMYSRCRDLGHAFMLFHRTEEKGLITWNAMLSGYAHMDKSEEVTFLFREMLQKGMEPNYVTIASVLPLCARISNLQHGKEFHCYIMKHKQFEDYLLLWNALVDMYSWSGRVLEARKVFDSLTKRDEVTYTSMIFGYGMKGEGETVLKLFEEMCKLEIKPDHVTMVAVLTACSHSGLVAQGQSLFKRMINVHGIVPRLEHYACMVDLFGRAGLLNKAKEFITGMPYKPTSAMWATLRGACRIHGNTVMGEWAAGKLLEMMPDHSGYYVLIANMYAAAGCWSKLAEVRTYMRNLGVRKAPGFVDSEFSPFSVGDTSNPHASEIYPLMDGLNELMKDAGYVHSEELVSSEEDFEEMDIGGNSKVRVKNECFKEWSRCRNSETWDKYKIARNETKKAVSEARAQAFDGLYQALGTRDGERSIYRLAKGRERKTRDLDQVKCVKNEEGKVLVHEKDIKERWKAYFHNLFNDGYGYDSSSLDTREEDRNYKYYRRIQKQEVKVALTRMSNGKAVGPDNIPIEVWKTLGDRGSTLSPYLFTLILDVLTEQIQEIAPRCMLFADDIVLLGESREELNERLETWRRALETHGFRLSRSKSEYMECKFNKRRRVSNSEVKIGDHINPQVTRFKYLGFVIQDDGEIEGDMNHRIQAGWMKWRKASGVLCDAKVPIKLKGKFYRTAVRPAILYGTECWAVKSQHENKVGVAEMRMLRWMCGKTRQDKIRNEAIRERVRVAPIVEKMVENRLRWFGHVERRPVDSVVRRVDQMKRRQTIRGRGRPKKTIREVIKKDLELNDLDRSVVLDRTLWRKLIHVADPT